MNIFQSGFARKKWNTIIKTTWFFPLCVLVIAIAAISIITMFRQNAERNGQVELYLEKLKAGINEHNALEWEAIAKEEVNEETSNEYKQLQSEIAANLFAVKRLTPNWIGLQEIEATYNEYNTAIERELQLIAQGQIAEAYKVDSLQVVPSYDQLNELINKNSYLLAQQANSSAKMAEVGAAITEVLTVFLILFLFTKFIKVRKMEVISQIAYKELDQIFETAADGMRVVDIHFNIIRANERFALLSGISKRELIGRKCYDVFYGPNCHSPKCPLIKIKNGDEHFEIDVVKERLDGTRVPCIVTATPFRRLNGELIGIVEDFKDITDREQADADLKEQKEFSENLIRSSAVPAFVLDSKHNILFWNIACEKLTGIKAVDMIGTQNHWQPFYDHPRPCLSDIIIDGNYELLPELFGIYTKSEILENGLNGEGWFSNLAGETKYLVIDTAPVYNSKGELIAAIETIQDITQRKLAEEALKKSKEELSESEQTLRATFEQAAVGIVHADLSGRWQSANEKFCKIVGYSAEEILQMKFEDFTYHEDLSGINMVQDFRTGDIPTFALEKRYIHKNGSIVWVNLTVSLVRDSMNSPKFFIGIIEDISARKKAEEILSEHNRRISKELALAQSIQASLFPINLPQISGVSLAATTIAANEVGGDYCDLFLTKNSNLGIAIGDVMGKGIPAAMFAAMTYAYVRNFASEADNPSALVNQVNKMLFSLLELNQQFLTFFYGVYNPSTKVFNYSNAGHNPPLLYRDADGEIETLASRSFYIGGRENAFYKEGSVNLNPGDIILFYTDGLKEGKNTAAEQFGMERITKLLKNNYMQDPASIQDIIVSEFYDFLSGEAPYDDVTMVIIKII